MTTCPTTAESACSSRLAQVLLEDVSLVEVVLQAETVLLLEDMSLIVSLTDAVLQEDIVRSSRTAI